MNKYHIIATRLLSKQMSVDNILDKSTILGRLNLLTQNLIPSLNNQIDLDFQFVLLVNPKISDDNLKMVQEHVTTTQPKFSVKFIKHDDSLEQYFAQIFEQYDRVAITRTDDDDFIYNGGTRKVKELLDNMESNMIVCGYNRGYMYVEGDNNVTVRDFGCGRNGHMSIFQTYIYDTKKVKYSPELNPYSVSHDLVKKTFEERGYQATFLDLDKDDEIFVIYYRHEQAQMYFYNKKRGVSIKNDYKQMGEPIFLNNDVCSMLKSRFGFQQK